MSETETYTNQIHTSKGRKTMSELPTQSIEINGIEYVPASTIPTGPTERRIVIGQRGWAFIGTWTENDDEITLSNASVIRRWGTTNGLGQLAVDGPTANTKLDPAGTVRMHRLAVVAALDVTYSGAW
jgi:hypothetical protein